MNAALRRQQRALVAAIVGAGAAPGPFAPNGRGGPPLLDAYRVAYGARLTAALRDNHEVLARALGDAAFEALAVAYIAAQPSRRPSIRWFGDRLAEFMAAQHAAGAPCVPHPALIDFARMDRALRDAFDAADAVPIGCDALAGLAPEAFAALRFTPLPSLRLVALDWAIEPAWTALRDHDPAAGAEPELPVPEAAPHALLVWRPALQVLWRSLADDEAAALRALVGGGDFAAMCAIAASPVRAASWLAAWLDEGLFAGFG